MFPAFFSQRLQSSHDLRMSVGKIVGFPDIGFKVEQRDADLTVRVFTRLSIVSRRIGMIVIVRQVQFPFAAQLCRRTPKGTAQVPEKFLL